MIVIHIRKIYVDMHPILKKFVSLHKGNLDCKRYRIIITINISLQVEYQRIIRSLRKLDRRINCQFWLGNYSDYDYDYDDSEVDQDVFGIANLFSDYKCTKNLQMSHTDNIPVPRKRKRSKTRLHWIVLKYVRGRK